MRRFVDEYRDIGALPVIENCSYLPSKGSKPSILEVSSVRVKLPNSW